MILQKILDELQKFVSENPTCDSAEIAEHFYNLGRNARKKEEAEEKKKERSLPRYYGD